MARHVADFAAALFGHLSAAPLDFQQQVSSHLRNLHILLPALHAPIVPPPLPASPLPNPLSVPIGPAFLASRPTGIQEQLCLSPDDIQVNALSNMCRHLVYATLIVTETGGWSYKPNDQ